MYKLTDTKSIIRIPDNAHIPDDPANSDYQQYAAWLLEGNSPEPADSPALAKIQASFTSALEANYDSMAQSKRYDNRLTCTLRAGYPGPFQAEGVAFAVWMDECNVYAYGVMEAVLGGARAMPTTEELISELPELVWP